MGGRWTNKCSPHQLSQCWKFHLHTKSHPFIREARESLWKAFQWICGENNLLSQKTLTLFDTFDTIPHNDHHHPHILRSPWNALKALNALKAPSLSQLQYCYLTLGSIPGWIGFPWKAENPYLVQINQPFRLNKKVAVVRWPGGCLAKVVNCLSSNSPSRENSPPEETRAAKKHVIWIPHIACNDSYFSLDKNICLQEARWASF